MPGTPPLVHSAIAAARSTGFPLSKDDPAYVPGRASASLPGTGRFLAMLAAGCQAGRIAELGTGTGIGTAWMASAMPADCTLVTAELDPARAAVAAEVLAADPRVQVLTGDAITVLAPLAPFDLIFSDGGMRDTAGFAQLVGMLRPGGHIVLDDVTPMAVLPPDSPLRQEDFKRDVFAAEERLVWAEAVLADLENSLLVGTRIG